MNVFFFFISESVGLRFEFGKGEGSVATDAGKLMAMQKKIDELDGQMEAVACARDRGERVAARPQGQQGNADRRCMCCEFRAFAPRPGFIYLFILFHFILFYFILF